MTDKEINSAIAEEGGWHGINPVNGFIRVPNYCNDLNAMHAAVATLSEDEYGDEGSYGLFELRGCYILLTSNM